MNYDAIAQKTAAVLAAKGKAAVIVRTGNAEGWDKKFDAAGGHWYWEDAEGVIVTEDPATATEIPCAVVEDRFQIRHIDGTLVRQSDRLFLCSEQPEIGDRIQVDGAVLTVINTVPIRPAEVTIYTEVQAR